jgi:hypothetical protein
VAAAHPETLAARPLFLANLLNDAYCRMLPLQEADPAKLG